MPIVLIGLGLGIGLGLLFSYLYPLYQAYLGCCVDMKMSYVEANYFGPKGAELFLQSGFFYFGLLITCMLLTAGVVMLWMSRRQAGLQPKAKHATIEKIEIRPPDTRDIMEQHTRAELEREIARVARQLQPFGPKYTDKLGQLYLAIGDKSNLLAVVEQLLEGAKRDAASTDPAAKPRSWVDQQTLYVGKNEGGFVVVLRDGRTFVETKGNVREFAATEAYMRSVESANIWSEVLGDEEREKIVGRFFPRPVRSVVREAENVESANPSPQARRSSRR